MSLNPGKRKLICVTEFYKTYIERDANGDITTVYNLVSIKQKNKEQIFSSRVQFLWKHKHLFSIAKMQFDHTIKNIESLRPSNIGTYLKTLTITEPNSPSLLQYISHERSLNYDEITKGIDKLSNTLRQLHSLGFPYGALSLETVELGFTLRHPPLLYSAKALPSFSNNGFISFTMKQNTLQHDIHSFGLFLYSIIYDTEPVSQITGLVPEDLPKFIHDLVCKNNVNQSSQEFTDDLMRKIHNFISNRRTYIEIR